MRKFYFLKSELELGLASSKSQTTLPEITPFPAVIHAFHWQASEFTLCAYTTGFPLRTKGTSFYIFKKKWYSALIQMPHKDLAFSSLKSLSISSYLPTYSRSWIGVLERGSH